MPTEDRSTLAHRHEEIEGTDEAGDDEERQVEGLREHKDGGETGQHRGIEHLTKPIATSGGRTQVVDLRGDRPFGRDVFHVKPSIDRVHSSGGGHGAPTAPRVHRGSSGVNGEDIEHRDEATIDDVGLRVGQQRTSDTEATGLNAGE